MERKEERKAEEKEKGKRMKRKVTSQVPVARSVRVADIKYTCPICGYLAFLRINVKVLRICTIFKSLLLPLHII